MSCNLYKYYIFLEIESNIIKRIVTDNTIFHLKENFSYCYNSSNAAF